MFCPFFCAFSRNGRARSSTSIECRHYIRRGAGRSGVGWGPNEIITSFTNNWSPVTPQTERVVTGMNRGNEERRLALGVRSYSLFGLSVSLDQHTLEREIAPTQKNPVSYRCIICTCPQARRPSAGPAVAVRCHLNLFQSLLLLLLGG